jgi:hypothetical protein
VIDRGGRASRIGEYGVERILDVVCEPGPEPQRLLRRRRFVRVQMQRVDHPCERLRTDYRTIEPAADPLLDMARQRDAAGAGLAFQPLRRSRRAGNRIHLIIELLLPVRRIDPCIPPHELLDRGEVGRRVALRVRHRAVERDPVRQPAARLACFAGSVEKPRRPLDREAEKIVPVFSLRPVECEQHERGGQISAHGDSHEMPPRPTSPKRPVWLTRIRNR